MKINRGNYEQEAPFYSAKVVLDDEKVDETAEFNRLRGLIDPLLIQQFQDSKIDLSKVRIRVKDGKQYPSATSIINPDEFKVDPEYGVRGTEIHKIVYDYLRTGKWREPSIPLKRLKYEDIPYKKFFEIHGDRIKIPAKEVGPMEVFNERFKYSGEIDQWGHVDGHPSLIDFKTGAWKWLQVVAYGRCVEAPHGYAIFDLKKCELKTLAQGHKDIGKYWENFLVKRGVFLSRFGV